MTQVKRDLHEASIITPSLAALDDFMPETKFDDNTEMTRIVL